MKKTIAIYPTSADPPTLGHVNILSRAASKFDAVYWIVAINPKKKPQFSVENRLAMMNKYIEHLKLTNVILDKFEGAVVRYAKEKGADFLLRGLRNSTDFQFEIDMASTNRHLEPAIETVCIFADPFYSNVSSSLVRELARLGENYSKYVIKPVADIIEQSLNNK